MIDMKKTIIPKSDQLNTDDLISGPITIKISKVELLAAADQPISIHYDGENGRPYKPCKSMRRVMVHVWGGDGNAYIGRIMTLFRDPEVKWGGEKVGGIRISHMSGITDKKEMALTATRGSRKAYTVLPLAAEQQQVVSDETLIEEGDAAADHGTEALRAFWGRLKKPQQEPLLHLMDGWKERAAQFDKSDAVPF